MSAYLKKLYDELTAGWERSVSDQVLGVLRIAEVGDWWEGTVTLRGRPVSFCIGGEGQPDARLVAHAHDIVRAFADFEHQVAEVLAAEARDMEHLRPFADEIRQLVIDDVCLFWLEKPDDGTIGFRGPDEVRMWRCDYIGRKPEDSDLMSERPKSGRANRRHAPPINAGRAIHERPVRSTVPVGGGRSPLALVAALPACSI